MEVKDEVIGICLSFQRCSFRSQADRATSYNVRPVSVAMPLNVPPMLLAPVVAA